MTRRSRIFIRATTRANRHQLTDAVSTAISGCGGWVLDFKLFANHSLSLAFEIPVQGWPCLLDQFSRLDWRLDDHPSPILVDPNGEVSVALHLTFIHDEGDLRRPVPPIPG